MNYGCKDKEIPYALCFQPLRFNVNYEKEAAIPRKNDRLPQRLLCLEFKLFIAFRSSLPPRYILSGIALPSEQ